MPTFTCVRKLILAGAISLLGVATLSAGQGALAEPPSEPSKTFLHEGWQLQSSCVAKASGEKISSVGFDAASWHKATIPATVVGALVTDKTYADPDYAKNLRSFPGMDYSDKSFFALQDMPKDSPFRCSWWYRTEFATPAGAANAITWLHFLGINYRANLWINGKKLAGDKEIAGTYRTYEFDVTKYLQAGKSNASLKRSYSPDLQ